MDLLRRVGRIVEQRQKQYGPPIEHHKATAQVWTILLRRMGKLAPGAEIHGEDIGLLYGADKLVREAHEPMQDNRDDVCGYMACREAILTSAAEPTELEKAEERGILARVTA